MKHIILSNYKKKFTYYTPKCMKTEREKSIEKDLHPNVTVVITEAWDLR
jgi:hypothetical protein